jgi:hypothetical protein
MTLTTETAQAIEASGMHAHVHVSAEAIQDSYERGLKFFSALYDEAHKQATQNALFFGFEDRQTKKMRTEASKLLTQCLWYQKKLGYRA